MVDIKAFKFVSRTHILNICHHIYNKTSNHNDSSYDHNPKIYISNIVLGIFQPRICTLDII